MLLVATHYRKGLPIGHRQRSTGMLCGSERDQFGDVITLGSGLLRRVLKPPQRDVGMENVTARRPKSRTQLGK